MIWHLLSVEINYLLVMQDNFGRLHDRSKETPKTMKQLTRLFPNKVMIQLPQVLSLHSVYDEVVLLWLPEGSNKMFVRIVAG